MNPNFARPNRSLPVVASIAALTLGGVALGDLPPQSFIAPPSGLVLLEDGCDEIRLQWSDNSGVENRYEVWQRQVDLSGWGKVLSLPANATQASLPAGSWTGTWCEYKVRAVRITRTSTTYSGFSNVVAGYRGCPH